jgi:hypothetical protein
MVDLAESAPEGPAARDALLWVINQPGSADMRAYGDQFARATALLVRHHGDDPEAVRIGLRLDNRVTPPRDALLLGFYASAKGREARGLARLALAQYLAKKAEEVVYAKSVEGRPKMRLLRGGKVVREVDLIDEQYAYHLELRQCDPELVLLGVDCEADKNTARQVMARERMTWPNWFDGDTGTGPIAGRYHIRHYPSVCLLDHKGVIRGREAGGLDRAVDKLLKEMKQPASDAGTSPRASEKK